MCAKPAKTDANCCILSHASTRRHTCVTCDGNRCCAGYEQCVSCCLRPSEVTTRAAISAHRSRRHYDMRSAFDICAAACRSDSSSVVHENAYKHAKHHCFGLEAPDVDLELHGGVFDFATPLNRK